MKEHKAETEDLIPNFIMTGLSTLELQCQKKLDKRNIDKMPSFGDVEITKLISDQSITVYAGYSPQNNKHVVLKVFPKKEGKLDKSYLRESRFFHLDHPNIIKFYQFANDIELGSVKASAIFMEQAKCDFMTLISKAMIKPNEKLARTFFRNLIDALEYIHVRGVAHLDIKLDNLLLGKDYLLKLADFKNSFVKGDLKMRMKGSKNFRAPEMIDLSMKNPFLSDIYSAGVCLFTITYGALPYTEDKNGEALKVLLWEAPEKYCDFVAKHLEGCDIAENREFKKIFLGMCSKDPKDRMSIADIKRNNWFRGPVYSEGEVKLYIKFEKESKSRNTLPDLDKK